MMKVLLPLMTAAMLVGCQVSAKIPPPVEIKVDGGGGSHCPPGQGKKGRC
jgi:hypothetical protein